MNSPSHTPDRIWLFQDQGGDVVWCNDADPDGESRDGEAVEYVRADLLAQSEPLIQGDVIREAQFLCDRLSELECGILDDEVGREYYGHVAPSRARLSAALAAMQSDPPLVGEG